MCMRMCGKKAGGEGQVTTCAGTLRLYKHWLSHLSHIDGKNPRFDNCFWEEGAAKLMTTMVGWGAGYNCDSYRRCSVVAVICFRRSES